MRTGCLPTSFEGGMLGLKVHDILTAPPRAVPPPVLVLPPSGPDRLNTARAPEHLCPEMLHLSYHWVLRRGSFAP